MLYVDEHHSHENIIRVREEEDPGATERSLRVHRALALVVLYLSVFAKPAERASLLR